MAEVYLCLAEVFGQTSVEHTPKWMTLRGVEWPLLSAVVGLSEQRSSIKLEEAIQAISSVGAASVDEIQKQYQAIFNGNGKPPVWLYESYYVDGRVPGPSTFAVKKLYSTAGVEAGSSELPDHASMEWAFLAHLAEKEGQDLETEDVWLSAQRLFIKNHLMRWFPDVVWGLISSEYPAWIAVGRLCEALFNGSQGKTAQSTPQHGLPIMIDEDKCTLCGFCVQECPTQALKIREDEYTTALWLSPSACNGCQKCIRVCPEAVLSLSGDFDGSEKILLRESPRSICPGCGKPTVSEAELALVVSKIGNPAWLAYCLDCR